MAKKKKQKIDRDVKVKTSRDTREGHEGEWYFNAYVPKRKRRYGFKSEKEAYLAGIEFYINHTEPTNITFASAAELYDAARKLEVADSTRLNDRTYMNGVLHNYFGDTLVEDIDYAMINSFRVKYSKDGASNNTINEAMSVLKRVYWFADLTFNLDLKDAFRHIKPLPYQKSEKAKNNFVSYEQFEKVMAQFTSPESYLKAAIMFYSGMRPGEVSALKIDAIDFDNNTLVVRRTVGKNENGKRIIKETTKNGEKRTVEVSRLIIELIEFYLEDVKRTRPVHNNSFLFHKPTADNFRGPLNTAIKRADLDKVITPHGFRHSYSTILLENDIYIKRVADNLGHANPTVTLRTYAHAIPKSEDPIVNVMDNLGVKITSGDKND
ncbi:site-specific integrase [Erysipelotrichaceae bacterium OttesenSCG-928-M19]|nr:site-specific integrase [Erysipelotrichaceae bacterium OttesenSCG-928-M19]